MRYGPTIQLLGARWAGARVLQPAFPLLARGQPLEIEDIARAAGASVKKVTEALDSGRCERDDAGCLVDLYGMTLAPTLHRLEIGRKILFSCCALWAHVIPKLVGQAVLVESVDPSSRELIRLGISPEGVTSAEPAGAVATMVEASREAVQSDVCAAVCCHVRHFISKESAENFSPASPARHVLGLAEFEEVANELYRELSSAATGGLP